MDVNAQVQQEKLVMLCMLLLSDFSDVRLTGILGWTAKEVRSNDIYLTFLKSRSPVTIDWSCSMTSRLCFGITDSGKSLVILQQQLLFLKP